MSGERNREGGRVEGKGGARKKRNAGGKEGSKNARRGEGKILRVRFGEPDDYAFFLCMWGMCRRKD